MARISRDECQKRREDILNVAEQLYQQEDFKDITIKEIGHRLSFTRTAIYSYFDNKEEIFLALLAREYLKWEQDLQGLLELDQLEAPRFAQKVAQSVGQRSLMLKILAVDMASLDAASRMASLVSFKSIYGRSLEWMTALLEKHFPQRSSAENQAFIFTFFPFLYGVYPYTQVTEKQQQAMAEAHVPYQYLTATEMVERCILQLLK